MSDIKPGVFSLSAGTLALLVVIVVPVLSLLMLLVLFIRHHGHNSEEEVHCARCHMLVAVSGVERPPHSLSHSQPSITSHTRDRDRGDTRSLLRRAPQSSPILAHTQHQASVPDVLVSPPPVEDPSLGQSATFQRLGMRKPNTSLSEQARTLESRVPSQQDSPPDNNTQDLEAITPNPIVSVSDTEERPQIPFQAEEYSSQASKMDRVRMIQFPHLQTPIATTPSNAARKQRKPVGSLRSVSVLKPTRFLEHDKRSDQPLLEVSHLNRTELTSGDLEELIETSLTVESKHGDGVNSSNSLQTPVSGDSVESQSKTITEKSVQLKELLSRSPGDAKARQEAAARFKEDQSWPSLSTSSLPIVENSGFVTTRNEKSLIRSFDDVFLEEEESESFKRQVGEQQAEAEQVAKVQYQHPLSVTSQAGCMVKPYCMVGGKEREGKVRSSSLPTDNKHSLVELLNQQKEQHRLFPSSLEKELVRCPPNFPKLDRRDTLMVSGHQAEKAQGW